MIVLALFIAKNAVGQDTNRVDTNRSLIGFYFVGPQFPGGYDSLYHFINHHLIYPKEALENSIQGTVYMLVAVETDGTLSSIKVIRGIGYGCDEEAIRLFEIMPPWIPAKDINGNPIRHIMNIPIKFILQG